MRIAQVTGFLGSGKTTFLIEVAKELNSRGLKVATIVNDVGHINVDRKCMEVHGIDTMEISGGCICCEVQGTLTTTVTNIYMSFKPDVILVEPTGVAIPLGLKQAAAQTVKKMPKILEQSPIVTFVDAMRIDKLMNNVRRLVETQIIEADAVLINKVDAVSEERLRSVTELVKGLNPNVRLIYGSARTGQGIKEVADLMVNGEAVVYDLTDAEDRFDKKYGE
ncbi:MAG TPA: GTP-binding protein [Methanomassiliicoccales archaeon]|nr:GTP-binding protein [Methanomassiliicoccales archaeon]